MAPDIIERWKALCLPLLPFTHARSESINADSLNSNFLQLGRRSGSRSQRTVFTPCGYLSTVWYPQPSDCWSDALPVVPPTHRSRSWTLMRYINRRFTCLLSNLPNPVKAPGWFCSSKKQIFSGRFHAGSDGCRRRNVRLTQVNNNSPRPRSD